MVALACCATTTVDTDDDGTGPSPSGPTTTTTAPTGTAIELLERLVAEAVLLSEHVVENDGDDDALARAEALWAAARPSVERERRDLVVDFAAAMELVRRSVERRRPADADKAANNLRVLTDSFAG